MSSDQTSTAWHIRNNADTQQAILDLIGGNPSNLPYATETTPGVTRFATVPDAEAGIVDNEAVTPAGVAAAIIALSPENPQPYVSYTVHLTQSGTSDPVAATTFENGLSGTPALARSDVGLYTLTLASAFVQDKTALFYSGVTVNLGLLVLTRSNVNQIQIETYTLLEAYADGVLNSTIEIRVYA